MRNLNSRDTDVAPNAARGRWRSEPASKSKCHGYCARTSRRPHPPWQHGANNDAPRRGLEFIRHGKPSLTTDHMIPIATERQQMSDAPKFQPNDAAAGGWGALHATAKALREQSALVKGGRSLLSMNQPDGFDCPGCAWPDPKHTSSFEFCENGAKAVAWETTEKRVTREFFATWPVGELERQSDYWLEEQGRLTEPMRYDA